MSSRTTPTTGAPRAGDLPIARLRQALLRWYRECRRELPWRETRDPYAIWVSEIMLQQTQVVTVVPYYGRFLERFPDIQSLAEANEEEVLSRWSGLGYYRRARALHAGARVVMERHGGQLPRDPRELLALPGVGAYTAGAIASVAFDRPEPILDGNVHRVFSRWLARPGSGHRRSAEDRPLWDLAGALVRGKAPGDLNQSLMELGALVCTPRKPLCNVCPVRRHCAARASGDPERFPAPRVKPATVRVEVVVAWIVRGQRVLVERPSADSPLRGVWDLPAMEYRNEATPTRVVQEMLQARYNLETTVDQRTVNATHGIMNRRLRLTVHRCRLRRGRASGRSDLRWIDPEKLSEIATSGATRKICRLMAG